MDGDGVRLAAARAVIMRSINGEHWIPVEVSEVPAFIKAPDTLGRLLNGEACQGPQSDVWYGALRAEDDDK